MCGDGKYESVPPFGAFETYEFPAPIGPLPVYSVDHEEVDTLPRFIGKGVRYVDFKLALDPPTVQTLKLDRKSTRLNSSHVRISYAVFCLKKKKKNKISRSSDDKRRSRL